MFPRKRVALDGSITNLATNGGFIETALPLEVGELVEFELVLPDTIHKIDILGVVRWHSQEKPTGIGVEFLRISSEDQKTVNAFVQRQLEPG